MRTLLVLLVSVALSVAAGPAPKIDSTSWSSLLNIGSDVEIKSNGVETDARSTTSKSGIEDKIERYLKSHDISFSLPMLGSKVALEARNLDNNELKLKLSFGGNGQVEARKKSKLKKIFAPILIIILIKAMTLIPLALGILGLKTWNAVQLSFVSFVSAIILAVWKLCSKIGHHHHHEAPQIIHEAWDRHHHLHHPHLHHHHIHDRNDGQQMAYSSGYGDQQTMQEH